MNRIFAMAHNEQICKEIERLLNELIRSVYKDNGMIWLQSKTNKDYICRLNDEVTIGYMLDVVEPKTDEKYVYSYISDVEDLDEVLYPAERDESYKEYKEKENA